MRKRVLGFTLIELMIVVAIIAIIAAIAIPGLLRARIAANEGSASASMRSLAAAQEQFKKGVSVDQDQSGTGEYGVFNELTGVANRRGVDVVAFPGGAVELPALQGLTDMSVALQATQENFSTKSGYYLKIWLPGPIAGGCITDNGALPIAPLVPLSANVDRDAIQQQENRWICYAWPASYRSSGVRCFVCDQQAEVFGSANNNPADNTGFLFSNTQQPDYNTAMSILPALPVGPTPIDWRPIVIKENTNVVDRNHTWLPSSS
jgi:prepilin-type N-terminal cleavage/methylation domain-containing protein